MISNSQALFVLLLATVAVGVMEFFALRIKKIRERVEMRAHLDRLAIERLRGGR